MATNESTATAQAPEVAPKPMAYAFSPVSNHHDHELDDAMVPGHAFRRHMDKCEDVAHGTASILRLIEWDELRAENHECDPETQPAPVLNDYYRNTLLRLVAVSMEMLASDAVDFRRHVFTRHTPEGKAERLADALRLVKGCKPAA